MVFTCGFEESKRYNPQGFGHMRRFHELERHRIQISMCHPQEIITRFQRQLISRLDFDSLSPGTPVTAGVVDFAFRYLQNVAEMKAGHIVMVSTAVSKQILLGDRFALLELLETRKFVFLPLECDNGGWSLVIAYLPLGQAFSYTSASCKQGPVLVQGVLKKISSVIRGSIRNYHVGFTFKTEVRDLGLLMCEVAALLVRRLIQGGPARRINLGLEGTQFVLEAGRTLLQTLILSLLHNAVAPGVYQVPVHNFRTTSRTWETYRVDVTD